MADSLLNCMTGTEFSVAFDGSSLVYFQVYYGALLRFRTYEMTPVMNRSASGVI
jgi:hypothetical protein